MLRQVVVLSPFKGSPYKLIRPIDYQGATCQSTDATSYNIGDLKYNRPVIVFPRLAEDALAIYQQVQSQGADGNCATSSEGCFYGVCMGSCPQPGDIVCNYPTETELGQNGHLSDYGVFRAQNQSDHVKALANARLGCWYINLPLTEVLGRCIPWEAPHIETSYDCVMTTSVGEARVPITECGQNTRKPIGPEPPEGCNLGQVEEELLRCEGVVEERALTTSRSGKHRAH